MYLEDHLNLSVKEVLQRMQSRIMSGTTYFGIPTLKNPLDFWVYREIIFEVHPDVIIEIGNFRGGSALALAHICDNLDSGRVIGIDIAHDGVPDIVRNHRRISLHEGEACEAFDHVRREIATDDKVLIIEDSAHTFDNTLRVLQTYAPLVTKDSYFIVEDSICHHGLDVGPAPGPYEAVQAFLEGAPDFESDRSKESFFLTWNPRGFLKRRA